MPGKVEYEFRQVGDVMLTPKSTVPLTLTEADALVAALQVALSLPPVQLERSFCAQAAVPASISASGTARNLAFIAKSPNVKLTLRRSSRMLSRTRAQLAFGKVGPQQLALPLLFSGSTEC